MSLIPVTVLTGFLGSGKTTLLRRLLQHPALARTAVIINEFGEIGLDHLLVSEREEEIVQLNSGCLCCSLRWDLVTTLDELHAKRSAGEIPAFERVVVETTGLADPAPILHTLITDPKLSARYRLDGVIATLDAVNAMATLDAHGESVKQAAVADRIVITKTDLAEAATAALRERLRALNPGARVATATLGEIDPARLFDVGLYDPKRKTPDVRRWLREEAYRADTPQDTHDHGHHEHDVNRHDDHIRAYCITRDKPVSGAAFSLFLELLMANRGADLLRFKGIVNVEETPGKPAVVHAVQHVFHPIVWLDAWPDDDQRSKLVFITRDVPQAWIEHLLDSLTGEVVAHDQNNRGRLRDSG
jgi:G3E family GTPase